MNSRKLADSITEVIFSKKGYDVKILDLREVISFADYFVICSADSDVQVKAIADEVDLKLKQQGISYWHKEGYSGLNWVLIDYVDVVVHVFRKESRAYYNLEKLWGDAPVTDVEDPALAASGIQEKKPQRKSRGIRK